MKEVSPLERGGSSGAFPVARSAGRSWAAISNAVHAWRLIFQLIAEPISRRPSNKILQPTGDEKRSSPDHNRPMHRDRQSNITR